MILRSLKYFWRIHLAVIAGAAVTTAVLTGALLVGDSVRGSLQSLVLERLGRIDYALVSEKFFREDLARDLNAVPAITASATAVAENTGARATSITVHGIDNRMNAFYESDPITGKLSKPAGQIFQSVVITQALQKELGVKVGDTILLTLQKPGDIHPETVLGERDISNVVRRLRLIVSAIVSERGPGGLTLRPHQTSPQNAFVDLKVLQRSLESNGKVNTIYANSNNRDPKILLGEKFQFHDSGLLTKISNQEIVLESSEIILDPRFTEKAKQAADKVGAKTQEIFTYLANTISTKNHTVPYSTITAIGNFNLRDDQILLNEWTAKDLQAKQGDEVEITYYAIATGNQLVTHSAKFQLAGILPMNGLAIDTSLAPEYPGIEHTKNISDWAPPFPVDLKLIRPIDEDYWDQYHAAPKAFISLNAGKRLWSSRFGNLTSLRILPPPGSDAAVFKPHYENELKSLLNPSDIGWIFQPVREQGLQAAQGSTDFGALFTGFSFFLIVSSAMLSGLLFRLGAEQRSAELGTLLAIGYTTRSVSRRLLLEGFILAAIGILIGTALAAFYAWLMLTGLRSWWQAAVGSSYLQLYIGPETLIIGAIVSLFAMLFSLWWSVRRLTKIPAAALLSGSLSTSEIRTSRWGRIIASVFLIFGFAFVIAASQAATASELFFAAGTCLLISALAFLTVWLRKTQHKRLTSTGISAAASMAARNTSRNPGRSLLSATLVACACFVIIAVGLNRRDLKLNLDDRNSGTGGYPLLAESTIPLLKDPATKKGRQDLGIVNNSAQITSFRLLAGEDASCLNLYRPEKPRILGVPQKQIQRDGFKFQEISSKDFKKNPWPLLEQDFGPGIIPAFGDYNSVLWILHLGLNKDLVVTDSSGKPLHLRLVGLLKGSIFQSEILISEKNFLRYFPNESGYSYFLIDAPADQTQKISTELEDALADYGFDAKSTGEIIRNYHAVENTYLSTFQTLGGLGLLLGTTGLGIILVRNVIERRGELATMRAFGYQRKFLALMVLAENAFLLCIGILTGALTAVITVAPHLFQDYAGIQWNSLLLTLVLVVIVGLASSIAAVSIILRVPLLPALKAE
jgi:ABC-type antimicrobial peptide transport system permease subunit